MRFEISATSTYELGDVKHFLDAVTSAGDGFFNHENDVIVTRAPGRLDVMGGIADYSGSLVLQLPIAQATFAAAQSNGDRIVRVLSHDRERNVDYRYQIPLDRIAELSTAGYVEIAASFGRRDHWASYVLGPLFVLAKEVGVRFDRGANIFITSDVPIGKGVSSSAAVEVATMEAVCQLYGVKLARHELALLCQKVENLIVGAACGVMDQMTSHCGRENHLLALVCQPAELLEPVAIPDALEFWGIDSGVMHAVVGSDYSSVRAAAFMGYRIIADAAALEVKTDAPGKVGVTDDRWNGFLANVTVDEYEREFRAIVPREMRGDDFLDRFKGSTDTVTSIDDHRQYQIKAATEHAIYESSRVKRFYDLLNGPLGADAMNEMGHLMFASHASYAACGLTEPRTDRLVEMVRQVYGKGLLGARITGGGSGGTVVILAREGSSAVIGEMAEQHANETGHEPKLFSGSSPGCGDFGHLRLSPVRTTSCRG